MTPYGGFLCTGRRDCVKTAEDVVQEGLAMQQRFWNVMFAGFPEEDRERFGKYLQKIAENLNTAYQEGIRNQ